jgi:hypothetical protein
MRRATGRPVRARRVETRDPVRAAAEAGAGAILCVIPRRGPVLKMVEVSKAVPPRRLPTNRAAAAMPGHPLSRRPHQMVPRRILQDLSARFPAPRVPAPGRRLASRRRQTSLRDRLGVSRHRRWVRPEAAARPHRSRPEPADLRAAGWRLYAVFVPTMSRYSCSKRAGPSLLRFHSSQNAAIAASSSSAFPLASACARTTIVGP